MRKKSQNAIPPKIYGLPKLQEQNIGSIPITSFMQSLFEKLSKLVKNIITKIYSNI